MKHRHEVLEQCYPAYNELGDFEIECIFASMKKYAEIVNPDRHIKTGKLIMTFIIGFLIASLIGFGLIVYQYNQLTIIP